MAVNFNKILTDSWNYISRKKTFEYQVVKVASTILLSTIGIKFSPKISAELSSEFPVLDAITYGREIMGTFVFWIIFILCIVMILFSLYLGYKNSKKKPELNLVFSQFSLSSDLEDKLKDTIEKDFFGVCSVTNSNIKQYFENGQCTDPRKALNKIDISIQTFINSFDSQSTAPKVIYGGMISTPFAFYTGMEMDDKFHIDVYDFNRDSKSWVQITDSILIQPHEILLTEAINAEDIVLIVNTSYPVNIDDVKNTFPNFPIAQLTIANVNVDNHWDLDFQKEFQKKFFEYVQRLSASKTKTIHLILATQNSIAFNLGRCYDNRNLPSLIAYQYEYSNPDCKYPWGVKVKTHGLENAEIIYNNR